MIGKVYQKHAWKGNMYSTKIYGYHTVPSTNSQLNPSDHAVSRKRIAPAVISRPPPPVTAHH